MKKLLFVLSLSVLVASAALLCTSCHKDVPENGLPQVETDPAQSEDETDTFDSFFTEEQISAMSETDKRILCAYSGKSTVEQIGAEHLTGNKTITIVGKHLTAGEYIVCTTNGGYVYKDNTYTFAEDTVGDSLDVLRYFTDVEKLAIYYNPGVTDFSFLAEMKNLKELTLLYSGVEDLSVLKNHAKLEKLSVTAALQFSKLELHPDAPLKEVAIEGALLSDMSIFGRYPSLTSLSISFSRVPLINTDVYAQLPNLSWIVCIAPDTDFRFLQKLSADLSLNMLRIGGTDNISLENIPLLATLLNFDLYECSGVDLTPLDAFAGSIGLVGVTDVVRGVRTTSGADDLRESASSAPTLKNLYWEDNNYTFQAYLSVEN